MEAQLIHIRKETQEYAGRCATEAREMVEAIEAEACNLENIEREAAEFLQVRLLMVSKYVYFSSV